MAFDPQREDYQRLGLRFARSLDQRDSVAATHEFATFGRRFAQDRDSLPQSDADRAFHLVARASKTIDYELPFASEERARQIIDDGHRILEEAISLDSHCYDAIRMMAAATNPSFDAFLVFLNDQADEVRTYCEEQRDSLGPDMSGERARLAADLAMRPYLRWIATQAEQALICGRNHEAIRLARKALEVDPHDAADVRFTASLAFAKLEDSQGLNQFLAELRVTSGRMRPADDAWAQLARLGLAYKRHDLEGARDIIDTLVSTYPHAAEALIRQNELPDGVFARLAVAPYSEDEIILALSEGTVLLQEGVDLQGRGVLSSWVAQETARKWPRAMVTVMAQFAQENAQGAGPQGQDFLGFGQEGFGGVGPQGFGGLGPRGKGGPR